MPETESWKRMVLRSMPPPAWLSPDAPHGDVVLSTRTRIMRNLRGTRFVNSASDGELKRVMDGVLEAARRTNLDLEVFKGLTNAERDYLVGCRLVSPDFEWTLPNRAMMVDRSRMLGLMVNEEDHIRAQAITAGWSVALSEELADACVESLREHLHYAYSPHYGYLAASPFNTGAGKRVSAMFHLIGLAQGKRLPEVLKALTSRGITVRGLFGEASRAIGAFAQVSTLTLPRNEFVGACDYLLREEREARASISLDTVRDRASQARDFAISSRMIGLADALRVLGWIRWAATAGLSGFPTTPRAIDLALTSLEIRGTVKDEYVARQRADDLRKALEV